MALAVTITGRIGGTNKNQVHGTFAFDDSYPTDGEPFTANQCGMSRIEQIFIFPYNGYTFNAVDVGTSPTGPGESFKAKAYGSTAGTEVSNATDLSSLTLVPWMAIGN